MTASYDRVLTSSTSGAITMLTMSTSEEAVMAPTPHLDPSRAPARAGALARLWQASPPLTAAGVLLIVAAAASAVGLLVDSRTITGAPAWLKPLKFAVSTAVYSFTLAWVFTYLTDRPRVRRAVVQPTAIVFALEVAIIDVQAWRGTTSHFNGATVLDRTLYTVMGTAIIV